MKFSINSFIYKHIIDRILSSVQQSIILRIGYDDRVLDVACGTGSLSIAISEQAAEVKGIDLSEEMIAIANDAANSKGITNVEFLNSDASDLSIYKNDSFDVAVTSMAIHQFDPDLAIRILKEMRRIAPRLIIMDYMYPRPFGFSSLILFIIERIAGGDHYRNFRKYNNLGGLDYFLSRSGLELKSDLYISSAFRVISCS